MVFDVPNDVGTTLTLESSKRPTFCVALANGARG